MAGSEAARMSWPGWDGWVVLACAAVVVAAWAARGVAGVEHWMALVLGLDLLYLGVTRWSRR